MFCFLMAIVLVAFPLSVFAWGPIAHIDYASEALRNLAILAPAVKEILSRFPEHFLYGALAADITVGKSYVDYIYNCHSWKVGFEILKAAKKPAQKAAAYGYLSHLAADIISHNFFVPYHTLKSFRTRTLGHVYWEMRFDAKRPRRVWNLAKEVGKGDFSEDDELFQKMIKRTIFSFKTNKRIFNSILTLHRLKSLKRVVGHLSQRSQHLLSDADAKEFRHLAVQSVITFLIRLDKAPCTRVDPTGKERLVYATQMRRQLRKDFRRGKISEKEAVHFLALAKRQFREGIYNRQVVLPDLKLVRGGR
ncbi:MAG: zinc dependent phospholipase C family protein [Deltaproteobacteria bacterium]|nr:zinc dependent phospholipase C family protein [Deltaproteobacteria bacterium]